MGFFPFFAPLNPWIIDVMNAREANPQSSILQKQPFAILTSAAKVVKGTSDIFDSDKAKRAEAVKKVLDNDTNNTTTQYNGCIIASNINNIELSYSTGATPVGIDFDGKIVRVVNETGRKVSTPIIESIDIDTDGANNTLKTAKINVRCFTLKQFELFEMFFLKPGMNLLLEWGDASLQNLQNLPANKPGQVRTGKFKVNTYQNGENVNFDSFTDVSQALVPKDKYEAFCNNFYRYFRSDTNAQADYVNRVERSLGTYDLVAGKLTDYSFSVEGDGTYNVSLEISQGNQISLATANTKPTKLSKTQTQPKADDYQYSTSAQIEEQIAADLHLDINQLRTLLTDDSNKPEHGGSWEKDWFNFLKINVEQKDTVASSTAYVSLRFILKILSNYILADKNVDKEFFELKIPEYKLNGSQKLTEFIPVTSHKFMMSSSDEVLFPRKGIPYIYGPTKEQNEKSATPANEETIQETKDKKQIDGRISGLDFHFDGSFVSPAPTADIIKSNEFSTNKDLRIGNALNIFVKYETVVRYWVSTYTRIDFLEKILEVVNKNGFGLYNLIYGVPNENGKPGVFDHRFAPKEVIEESEKTSYRFKPNTINSIVREFSFNFEMSNLVAARTIFNSGKFLAEAKKANPTKLELPPSAYQQVDNSTYGNADGWYSINQIEFLKIKANFDAAVKADVSGSVTSGDAKPEETTKEAKDLSEVVKSKSINFRIEDNASDNTLVVLVYKDNAFLRDKINQQDEKTNRPTVAPISVTIKIDGFSGFRCGQYFNIDGVPEIYNQTGIFQITNTKHNVSKDGWTTTVEAEFRPVKKTQTTKPTDPSTSSATSLGSMFANLGNSLKTNQSAATSLGSAVGNIRNIRGR